MDIIGRKFMVNGEVKTVKKYNAEWSLMLSFCPHILWILWEGETKYQRFESDNTGDFLDLHTV